MICFHCNQRGHKKADFPSLAATRLVAAPAPATLRIIDGRQGMAEAPVVRSRAFYLTVDEAHATPNVVTGMYLLLISLFIFVFPSYICVLLLGSFLVNYISVLVLFDSGVT